MWQVIQKRMSVTKASNFNVNHPFISEFKINIFSIPTCFAEARALFAEAILQKIGQKWHRGSSRKQIFRGSIRGSCGCVRGSYAEAFAEVRPYVQQSKKEFLTPLTFTLPPAQYPIQCSSTPIEVKGFRLLWNPHPRESTLAL